jgi:hypothetical protein
MKKTAFQRFALKHVVPQMAHFTVQGNLIYQMPVGEVLRAFLFDSSSHDPQTFNPTAFVQPLYVPADHIVMNLGERLPGVWKLRELDDLTLGKRLVETMKQHGVPLFDALGTPKKIADHCEEYAQSKDYYRKQACAYSLVLVGETQKALIFLDELLTMLTDIGGFQKWALSVYDQVASLRDLLVQDPSEAGRCLARWAAETGQKLDLPD